MTEDQAKEKWCPFFQVSATGNPTHGGDAFLNRPPELNKPFCIGSACMAWREIRGDSGSWRGVIVKGGYCGLSGKP